jgi:hypothetical protein
MAHLIRVATVLMMGAPVVALGQAQAPTAEPVGTAKVFDLTCAEQEIDRTYAALKATAQSNSKVCPAGYVAPNFVMSGPPKHDFDCAKMDKEAYYSLKLQSIWRDRAVCRQTIMTSEAQRARFDQVVDAVERACKVTAKAMRTDPAECSPPRAK